MLRYEPITQKALKSMNLKTPGRFRLLIGSSFTILFTVFGYFSFTERFMTSPDTPSDNSIIVPFIPNEPLSQQYAPFAIVNSATFIYQWPESSVLQTVPKGTSLPITAYWEGSNKDVWYQVQVADGLFGWVRAKRIEVLESKTPNDDRQVPLVSPLSLPVFDAKSVLYNTPLFSDISPKMQQIFQEGRAAGNRPNLFSTVGDCHTASDSFLMPLGSQRNIGINYQLGAYNYLGDTINFFEDGFNHESLAAISGSTIASIFDSTWSNDHYCGANEAPLDCEYRLAQPSLAFINPGEHDIEEISVIDYEKYLRTTIEKTLALKIIPVLSTAPAYIPDLPEYALYHEKLTQLNLMVIELAQEYEVPLIHFWLASQSEVVHGLDFENTGQYGGVALRYFNRGSGIDEWLYPLRNLLTLQMLDNLRTELPMY